MNPTTLLPLVMIAATLVLSSTAGLAATMMGNNSNKGSLLVFPRIDVRGGVDTFVTLINDSASGIEVNCQYRSAERVPTPLSAVVDTTFHNHTMMFSLVLSPNQPVTWSAATGLTVSGARILVPPFGVWPDGAARATGDLKCWAVGVGPGNVITQINYNQLAGTAVIAGAPFGVTGQAWKYNAWAFQAMGGTLAQGRPVGTTPGVLQLDGTLSGYYMCPNILVGAFQPGGVPIPPFGTTFPGGLAATTLSIVGCTQDLTQRATAYVTSYRFTFWNEDEFSRTGTYECGHDYYETNMPSAPGVGVAPNGGPFSGMPLAQYASLGTSTAYMRIESLADAFACANAVHFGMIGVISHANAGTFVRGGNLIGRGTWPGRITYDAGPPDSFKR